MLQIGLYVHRLRVFEGHERLELGSGPGLFDLRKAIEAFIEFYSKHNIESEDRVSHLELRRNDREILSGLIHYGSTGVASEIVDGGTNELLLERKRDDVERIPLYFCFYVPEGEDTWHVATQSFGGRSCSSVFNRFFRDFFAVKQNQNLTIQKVMPTEDQQLKGEKVQKLTLIRRRVPSGEFESQIGDLARELKVSMSISVDGRGALGIFDDIRDRMAERADVALVYDGIEFEEASATVKVGGSYRKVGLIGPSNLAGVLDLSDDVQRDHNDYPKFGSIDAVAQEICEDYLIEFRDQ